MKLVVLQLFPLLDFFSLISVSSVQTLFLFLLLLLYNIFCSFKLVKPHWQSTGRRFVRVGSKGT